MNIELIILRKKIEELRIVCPFLVFASLIRLSRPPGVAEDLQKISGLRVVPKRESGQDQSTR